MCTVCMCVLHNHLVNWSTTKLIAPISCTPGVQEVHTKSEVVHLRHMFCSPSGRTKPEIPPVQMEWCLVPLNLPPFWTEQHSIDLCVHEADASSLAHLRDQGIRSLTYIDDTPILYWVL